MKDNKTLLLLFVSILLLLASITLLWSWGYQFNFKHKENNTTTGDAVDNKKNARHISDSLQKAYYITLDHLDKTIDSVYNNTDSLKGNLGIKLAEFYQLRNQITDSFKNRAGDGDIKLASERIDQLQQKLKQLRISNIDVEDENKRLTSLLQQYSNQKRESITSLANLQEKTAGKKPAPGTNSIGAEFTASDLQLVGLAEESGKEQETVQADKVLKLAGSFTVKNKSSQSNIVEMIIVVLQPDGKVLQKSTWESGAFQTKAGNQIYSCKIQADCNSGEAKRLHFWLASDKYQKGNYNMQVYRNGVIIARITKVLS